MSTQPIPGDLDALLAAVRQVRERVATEGGAIFGSWQPGGSRWAARPSLLNLAHYLALRRRDLRPLQRALMPFGLSSLGRLEGRVLANLDAVVAALARMRGDAAAPFPGERAFFRGERLLSHNTRSLFGAPPDARRGRILVTLPGEAARDPALMRAVVAAGADAVRINCAHDDAGAWSAMVDRLRAAEAMHGRRVRVLMDLAGPKVRTGTVRAGPSGERLDAGDRLLLTRSAAPGGAPAAVEATISLPEILGQVRVGDRVFIDDGKFGGMVERADADALLLRIDTGPPGGARLRADKGLNFPDTPLRLDPLTPKDMDDLDTVVRLADMVGYSFVQRRSDVVRMQEELARRRPDWHRIGLVAKIETPLAVRNLPDLIVQAMGRQPFGLMIARGDLAVELGFERLAEMQEELLWLAEAAHVPVIWATQVLERMVKKGQPSRGEMTDAAMAARAECVMLNKGPHVAAAIGALDRLLVRMAEHQTKKTPHLRALGSWGRTPD